VAYGGGRRGLVVIPEGRGSRGWSGFAQELGSSKIFFQPPHSSGNRAVQAGEAFHGYPTHSMVVRPPVTVMGVSREAVPLLVEFCQLIMLLLCQMYEVQQLGI